MVQWGADQSKGRVDKLISFWGFVFSVKSTYSNGKAEVRGIEMKACNVTHCRKRCHRTSMESRWSCTSRFSSSRRGSAQRVQAPCFHHIREKFLQNLDIRSIPENRYCNLNLRRHFGILSKVRFAC